MTAYAALIGLIGVLIGVVLRPMVEELFARRTKTLTLVLKDDQGKLAAPMGGGLSLALGTRPIDQVIYRTFALQNRTGRTLREFQLELEIHFEVGPLRQYAHFEFDQNDGAIVLKNDDKSTGDLFVFNIRHLDRDHVSSGRILSTHPGTIRCRADNELEVKIVEERSSWNLKKHASTLWFASAVVAIMILILIIFIKKVYYA